ncbi:MAG: hypothetical protein IT532_09160 [Burkholderiales bacterium]|nr:hypothetical protein [Burkholderiales bacterium]
MRALDAFRHALLIAAGLTASSLALADTCSGRVNGVTETASTFQVEKGHTMTVFMNFNIGTSEDSVVNAAGRCGGYAITTPDGKTRVVGVCVRKASNGDSWADEWVLEPGAKRGTWKQIGGTGVFAGKNWSGWWEPISDDGKLFMGRWGGNCG